MPKSRKPKPKVNRLGLTKEEAKKIAEAPLGKKLNFHDFMEHSKKKLKKEYKKEKQHIEYSTNTEEEFIPK